MNRVKSLLHSLCVERAEPQIKRYCQCMQLFTCAPRVGTHENTVKETVLGPERGQSRKQARDRGNKDGTHKIVLERITSHGTTPETARKGPLMEPT
eukprot:4861887-Pyramimonas_sp.AAC.1